MFSVVAGNASEALKNLVPGSARCCVTSPPYWGLRNYGVPGQLGLEPTLDEYIANLVGIFRGVRRVLARDATLWLNLGDAYNAYNGNRGRSTSFQSATEGALPVLPRGHGLTCKTLKPTDLIGIPWRVALALQSDGWYLRSAIIWEKGNAMPESVRTRPTNSHEYVFLLSKSDRYFFDHRAIMEPAAAGGKRNARSVWRINTSRGFKGHTASMPPELAERCILAGTRPGDLVLDPFFGSGTVGAAALGHGRQTVGIELNPAYVDVARRRLEQVHREISAPEAP